MLKYQFDQRCSVWVHKTGCDARNHISKFGYELCGLTPHHFLACGRRVCYNCNGYVGADLTTGSVNGEKFLEFVHGTLNTTVIIVMCVLSGP